MDGIGNNPFREKKPSKRISKQMIQSFIEDEEVSEKLRRLTLSPLAIYKAPGEGLFPNLANILTVALNEKWGSEKVYKKYREWTASGHHIPEIAQYLDMAMKNSNSASSTERQTRITDYYSPDNENNDKLEIEGEK